MGRRDAAMGGGWGTTGGWAAKELCEAGLETLVLEGGRPVNPDTDSVEHVPVWQMKFRGNNDRKARLARQPIQRTCYARHQMANKILVDDIGNPYTVAASTPVSCRCERQTARPPRPVGPHPQ